jgi:hypothetical protein
MKLSDFRDFCRSVVGAVGFDDRLGVFLWSDVECGERLGSLLVARLRASFVRYGGAHSEDAFLMRISEAANRGRPVLTVLGTPPGSRFARLIERCAAVGSRPIQRPDQYQADPILVIGMPIDLYRSLPARDPIRKIGSVLTA